MLSPNPLLSAIKLEELLAVREVQNVRIVPGFIHFVDAYEGKEFEGKLSIQNCGTKSVLIRLGNPSSNTFRFKTFPGGKYLSPGMKIIRTVSCTYKSVIDVETSFADIWINEEQITYYFLISLNKEIISIEPQTIDFGQIDATNKACKRTFYIKNEGSKTSKFAIDSSINNLDVSVEPSKGLLPAKSKVAVHVEVISSEEKDFIEEIWVKVKPLQRVVIKGTFIKPKLITKQISSVLDFTVLNFEATYQNSSSSRIIFIRNFSSSDAMFVVMAELKGAVMSLEEACTLDENYKHFKVKPIEGRSAALKGILLHITFSPTKSLRRNYAACFLRVIRIDCKDVEKDFTVNTLSEQLSIESLDLSDTRSSASSDHSGEGATYTFQCYEDTTSTDNLSFESSIKLCLHAVKEIPNVVLTPTQLRLDDLILNQEYHKVVCVENKSKMKKITLKYKKVASVVVELDEFTLDPLSSLELLVKVRSIKMDSALKNLDFDLYDEGTRIGKIGIPIIIETRNVTKVVRFDQCKLCYDLADKLEQNSRYRFNPVELEKRFVNNEFYLNYVRSLWSRFPKEIEDYLVSNSKLILFKHLKFKDCPSRPKTVKSFSVFIPLPPSLLYKVKISPKSIKLRKVAAYTTITDHFDIENLNSFPIRIFVLSSKSCIVFDKDRHLIKSKEKRRIQFSFSTTAVGKYNVSISVLVNDSTVYEVTAVAHVVPKQLAVQTHEIRFTPGDGHFKFFKIINHLNAYTNFKWQVPYSCFDIFPSFGGIPAESEMLCMVTYTPDALESKEIECALVAESGQVKTIQVTLEKRKSLVRFNEELLDFGEIPLNVPVRKTLVLRNLKNFQVRYIVEDMVCPGFTVYPKSGLIDGLDSQLFIVCVIMKAVVEFSTYVRFYIDSEIMDVKIKGIVECPSISISPEMIYFEKIAPFACDIIAFKVKNLSQFDVNLNFRLEEYPEFVITETEHDAVATIQSLKLAKNQIRVLFLRFLPLNFNTHSLYLPFTLNNILGPVSINNSRTKAIDYFLNENKRLYQDIENLSFLKNLPALPGVRITAQVTEVIIKFSKTNLQFYFYGKDNSNNLIEQEFRITNKTNDCVWVCIRIDDLNDPFSMIPKTETYIEYYDVSFKMKLEPHEKAIFQVNFEADNPGEYFTRLPIFLRHYNKGRIFNYLTLKGEYLLPEITSKSNIYHFEAIPPTVTNDLVFNLCLKNHAENCVLTGESQNTKFAPIISKAKTKDNKMKVTFSYNYQKKSCIYTTVNFQCSCNSMYSLEVTGVVQRSLLTTHAFIFLAKQEFCLREITKSVDSRSFRSYEPFNLINIKTNYNLTSFPFFPDEDNDYTYYMRNVKKTLERWIFSQVFYQKLYYKIPTGFTHSPRVAKAENRYDNQIRLIYMDLPLVQIVGAFLGNDIKKELSEGIPETTDDTAWLVYTAKTYDKILDYLRRMSALLPHVQFKHLLTYEQYLQYQKIKHPNESILDVKKFLALSTQNWIDLILQIINVLFFERAITTDVEEVQQLRKFCSDDLSEREQLEEIKNCFYGAREQKLINWLITCYNIQKESLFTYVCPNRNINFLDDDLSDGVILGAVIAYYCPYIAQEIKRMFGNPKNEEEIFHNCCVLVEVARMLKFSYVLTPHVIFRTNGVEMLLFVSYLYNILPNLSPCNKIKIEAQLTQTNVASIELDNLGDTNICYKIEFFNSQQLFSVDNDTVIIKPRRKKKVAITYHAKNVHPVIATVLFSGETLGQKYSKSMVITLEGVADVSYVCMEIPIKTDLYRFSKITFKLEAPFKVAAVYSLLFGYESLLSDMNHQHLFPDKVIKSLHIPREFVLDEPTLCTFDEDGKSTSVQIVCCQQILTRDMWLYFVNHEIGDWGVKLVVTGKPNDACYEKILVEIPDDFDEIICRCKKIKSLSCAKTLQIQIPMTNHTLWNVWKDMLFYLNMEGKEQWFKDIYSQMGTRILKLLLNSETHPLRQIIEDSVTYHVWVEPRKFKTLKKIHIEDVIGEGYATLPIHPFDNFDKEKVYKLHLTSEDNKEVRFYKLYFSNLQ